MKKKISLITIIVAIVIFLFSTLIIGGIIYKINSPHLVEGTVVDKQMYPPVGKAIYPSYILVVEKNGIQDEWYVSESYYDGVRVGSYVKK